VLAVFFVSLDVDYIEVVIHTKLATIVTRTYYESDSWMELWHLRKRPLRNDDERPTPS
jgi:hypothetical protein